MTNKKEIAKAFDMPTEWGDAHKEVVFNGMIKTGYKVQTKNETQIYELPLLEYDDFGHRTFQRKVACLCRVVD